MSIKIGVGWLRTSKDGKKFLSLRLDGNFALFKNDRKTTENQPDYNLVASEPFVPKKIKTEPIPEPDEEEITPEDVPF